MLSVAKYQELEELDSCILDNFLPHGKRQTKLIYGRIVSNTHTKPGIQTFPGYNLTVQEVPPGNGNAAHIHKNTEIFLFLDGEWEIGYGSDAQEKAFLKGGDAIVVPAFECRTYKNISSKPGHIATFLIGESWVQFDKKVIEETRKFGAVCDDWGTLLQDHKGRPIVANLNEEHRKFFRQKEEFVASSPDEMSRNWFKNNGELGRFSLPYIPEGIEMEMVTVGQGMSVQLEVDSALTTVLVVRGRVVVQGVQLLGPWDTCLLESMKGLTESQVRFEGVDSGSNQFMLVKSSGKVLH